MPPDIGWRLAAGCLGCADESRRHVGDAVALVEVEGVAPGIPGVPEDVVVLGGPAFGGSCAVVVGPDDLVLEAVATKDLVEHDLAVVDFAVVDVEEEGAGGREDSVRFDQARAQEAEEVVEAVAVACASALLLQHFGAVAPAAEADAVACFVANGLHLGAALAFAGVEGGIDVDQLYGGGCQRLQNDEVISLHDPVHANGLRS